MNQLTNRLTDPVTLALAGSIVVGTIYVLRRSDQLGVSAKSYTADILLGRDRESAEQATNEYGVPVKVSPYREAAQANPTTVPFAILGNVTNTVTGGIPERIGRWLGQRAADVRDRLVLTN